MNAIPHVPPGFRFHPTDEELVDYYLRRKITSQSIDLDIIKDVDLYKIEPWDLQELCRIGTEEQNDSWYFFSHKDKKYPTGTRTNRATTAGFWKATGRDKAIYLKHDLIGMRKTLVFYKGRAPNGQKSDWIMHEYRLETDENGTSQEEGWVVCKVFKKKIATTQRFYEPDSPGNWFEDQVSFMPEIESPRQQHPYANFPRHLIPYNKKEMNLQYGIPPDHFLQLPLLESQKTIQAQTNMGCGPVTSYGPGLNMNPGSNLQSSGQNNFESLMMRNAENSEQCVNHHEVTDWRVLDKFVASQLSQDEISKENVNFPSGVNPSMNMNKQEMSPQGNGSTSSSGCPTDIWK